MFPTMSPWQPEHATHGPLPWSRDLRRCGAGCDIVDDHKTMELLKVPHGYKVALPLAVGYPDESPGPRPRWALEDIVFYEEFGKGGEDDRRHLFSGYLLRPRKGTLL